jgi:hypothetical protein
MSPATNVVPFRDSNSFDIDCIFGVEIGRDKSGNFALGLNGLAVRTPDDRFVVPYLDGGIARLVDASCLLFSGLDPYVFRFPVLAVEPGDLIVTADSPFSALFVVEAHGDFVRGVVPGTQQLVRYVPPSNIFGQSFFVKVFSIFNLFGGGGGEGPFKGGGGINPLFFLLCCGGREGRQENSLLTALLFSQFAAGGGFGAKGGAANFAPLLALLSVGGGEDLNPLLLLALSGGFNPGAGAFGNFGQRAGDYGSAGAQGRSTQGPEGGGTQQAHDTRKK